MLLCNRRVIFLLPAIISVVINSIVLVQATDDDAVAVPEEYMRGSSKFSGFAPAPEEIAPSQPSSNLNNAVSGPKIQYTGSSFVFSYGVGDELVYNAVDVNLYSDQKCHEGNNNDITKNDFLLYELPGKKDSTFRFDSNDHRINVTFFPVEETIVESPIYFNNADNRSFLAFCIELSIFNKDIMSGSVQVATKRDYVQILDFHLTLDNDSNDNNDQPVAAAAVTDGANDGDNLSDNDEITYIDYLIYGMVGMITLCITVLCSIFVVDPMNKRKNNNNVQPKEGPQIYDGIFKDEETSSGSSSYLHRQTDVISFQSEQDESTEISEVVNLDPYSEQHHVSKRDIV